MKLKRILLSVALMISMVTLISQAPQWTHFNSGKQVLNLESIGDNLWIGTNTGLAKIQLSSGIAAYMDNTNSPLTENWISGIVGNGDGVVWIASPNRLWRVEGDNWQAVGDEASFTLISKLKLSADGTLWCLISGTGILDYVGRYQNGVWTWFSQANSQIPGNVIGSMELDDAGNVYLTYYNPTSSGAGLAFFDGNSWTAQSWTSLGMDSMHYASLLFDGNHLWVSSLGSQLYRYSMGQVVSYDLTQELGVSALVTSLDQDAEGKLLIGIAIPGDRPARLARFDGVSWQLQDPNPPYCSLGLPVAVVEDTVGNLWFGSSNGLSKQQDGQWETQQTTPIPLPTNSITKLAIDHQDRVWLGLNGIIDGVAGIASLVGNDLTFYDWNDFPIPNPNIKLIVCDNDDKVWFTTHDASYLNETLTCFDGENWQTFSYIDGSFPSVWFRCLAVDANGHLWAQAYNRSEEQDQLLKYDGTSWSEEAFIPSLATAMIFDLTGNLWLGTHNGLLKYAPDGSLQHLYSGNSGLPNDKVKCLTVGTDNALWIGMEQGLAKYHNAQWTTWGPHDLLPGMSLTGLTNVEIDADAKLWLTSPSFGLLSFDGESWTNYTTLNSPLHSYYIAGLKTDAQQNLWLHYSAGGLSQVALNPSSIAAEVLVPVQPGLELKNYPNPFNPHTTISFKLNEPALVSLKLYNLKGQMVKELLSERKTAGLHKLAFDGKDQHGKALASGIYFARLQAGLQRETGKLILMK